MYIVLGTNTNHENAAYGPFDDEVEAIESKFSMAGADHLHEYHVMEVQEPVWPEEVEESDEEE